jgi:hypothetical protein
MRKARARYQSNVRIKMPQEREYLERKAERHATFPPLAELRILANDAGQVCAISDCREIWIARTRQQPGTWMGNGEANQVTRTWRVAVGKYLVNK